jgi:hypothetical protein
VRKTYDFFCNWSFMTLCMPANNKGKLVKILNNFTYFIIRDSLTIPPEPASQSRWKWSCF